MDLFFVRVLNGLAGMWPALDAAAIFFASYLQYLVGAVFVAYLLWTHRSTTERKLMALSGLASVVLSRGIITELIRLAFERPRPFIAHSWVVKLVNRSEYYDSFPSGHATFFFALATAVYLNDKKLGLWFFAGAVLMGVARIYAGVHWPSDIVGGALIGVAAGWLADVLVKRWWRRRRSE